MAWKEIEYKYTSYLDADMVPHYDRPFIDVTLSLGMHEIATEAMVDSGCTYSHVDAAYAETLGLDLSICQEIKVGGICGEGLGYMTEMVSFHISGCGEKFIGPTIFVPNLPFPVLLGQNNFFEKFEVKFYRAERRFTLKRVSE